MHLCKCKGTVFISLYLDLPPLGLPGGLVFESYFYTHAKARDYNEYQRRLNAAKGDVRKMILDDDYPELFRRVVTRYSMPFLGYVGIACNTLSSKKSVFALMASVVVESFHLTERGEEILSWFNLVLPPRTFRRRKELMLGQYDSDIMRMLVLSDVFGLWVDDYSKLKWKLIASTEQGVKWDANYTGWGLL